jgi:hypothetical protein
MDTFNLKKFLVENKLTPQSQKLKEDEDEFNVDAPKRWGSVKYLTVGDIVKSEYWDYDKDDTMWFGKKAFRHPDYIIDKIYMTKPFRGEESKWQVWLKQTPSGTGFSSRPIAHANERLHPEYQIVPPDSPELKFR